MTTTQDTPSMRTVAALERIADALERIDRRQDQALRERYDRLVTESAWTERNSVPDLTYRRFVRAYAADIARWEREDAESAQAGGGE